jgi:hypothetical protein
VLVLALVVCLVLEVGSVLEVGLVLRLDSGRLNVRASCRVRGRVSVGVSVS